MEQYEEVEDLATFFDLESKLQQERQKNERERQEKERERQEKERGVLLLISQGISIKLISTILQVPIKDIEDIQDKYKDDNPVAKYFTEHSEN